MALKQGSWPAFAIQQENSKWPHNQDGEMTPESIKVLVSKQIAGEIKPTMKSEEIPETNDGPVTVVVGKSFNDIVLDKSKDVLIEFYAPWW